MGIGVGHPEATSDCTRPLPRCGRSWTLSTAPTSLPRERRCLAALAPKMLALSAERSLGTFPTRPRRAHERRPRTTRRRPPDRTRVAFVLDTDTDRARVKARDYAQPYLGASNYTNNLRTLGFSDDLAGGGSDR